MVPQILTLYQKGQESHGPLEAMRKGQGPLESGTVNSKIVATPMDPKAFMLAPILLLKV